MVDSSHRLVTPQHLPQTLAQHLYQLSNHQITSQTLVQWVETQQWQLLEGAYKTDQTPAVRVLREILSDILLQWECLQAHHHDTAQPGQELAVEFPNAWLTTWLQQIQSTPANPMSNINFNAPIGNVNTGNTTIQRDQIGIQHNYVSPQNLAAAAKDIQELLEHLAQTYPSATETEIPSILNTELVKMERDQPQRWATLRKDLLNRERWFQGGKAAVTEATKQLTEKSVVVKSAIAFLEAFSKEKS